MKRLLILLLGLLPLAAAADTRLSGPWTASTGLTVVGSTVTATSSTPAPVRVFVAPAGNDANSCLTVGVPCATLQRALTAGTAMLNSNGGSLYIKMAAGSYTQSLFVNGPLTGSINSAVNPNGTNAQPGQVVVEGDGAATTTLTGSASYCATIASSNYANVAVRALRLLGNGAGCQSTLFAQMAGMIHGLDDLDFGPATVEHIHLENGGQFQGWFSYKVSGGAQRHIVAGQSSIYIHSAFPTGVITFDGTPTFSTEFAWATQSSTVQFNDNVTFVGTFTGTRYAVSGNSNIQTPSTSLTWIPGTVAGYSTTGGVYVGPNPPIIVGPLRDNGNGTYQLATTHNVPAAVGWPAALDPNNVVLAGVNQASTISALVGDVEIPVGAAATVSIFKVPSGTACSAGTILHSGSFNANGTAATRQTLTLTATTIAAGERVCLQTTGTTNWTSGVGIGTITIFLAPTP